MGRRRAIAVLIAIAALAGVGLVGYAESGGGPVSLLIRVVLLLFAVALSRFALGRNVRALKQGETPGAPAQAATHGALIMRFHDILDDDIGVYNQDKNGKTYYNFSYVDAIYDGLLANGVRPFVEISFMDRLAGAYIGPGATFPMRDVPPGVVVHVQIEKIYGQGPWNQDGFED